MNDKWDNCNVNVVVMTTHVKEEIFRPLPGSELGSSAQSPIDLLTSLTPL